MAPSRPLKRTEQLVIAALVGCTWCLFYPAMAAPVSQTHTVPAEPHQAAAPAPTDGGAVAASQLPAAGTAPLAAGTGLAPSTEPLRTQGYFCKDWKEQERSGRSCNLCHFRPKEIHPQNADPLPGGDSPQSRVEGTNVTRAELAEKGIRYLQVGGDWWNKCGDGWLNSDFVYTRLPIGFVCEDWRTGRYILRQDAGRRWPFEDASFDLVYSEHMFEHILPMDGSTFLREM